MNQTQVKYARSRAEQIYKEKSSQISEKHTKPAVSLSLEEKLAALEKGEYTVDRSLVGRYPNNWAYAIKFNGETSKTVDSSAIKRETEELTKKYNAICDELVLGDNEEALKLLKEFENNG